jgi:hypothetical protein
LVRSQPVTPPNSSIGESAVPIPNTNAIAKLSSGTAPAVDVARKNSKDEHITSPLLKPSEKARKSNFPSSLGLGLTQVRESSGLKLKKSRKRIDAAAVFYLGFIILVLYS